MGERAILLREDAPGFWVRSMMNTDVMRQLVAEAESGDKAMPTARAAARLWSYDDSTLEDFRYSANAIYTFRQHGIRRFMRLTWEGDKAVEHIAAELDYLAYLAERQFPVVQPVLSNQGRRIETISSPYANFYAVTFTAAGGAYKQVETLTVDEIETWGAMLGRLHVLSEGFHPRAEHQRPAWTDVMAQYEDWVPESETVVSQYLNEARAWLATLPNEQTSYGLIHWDFEPDNLTWSPTGNEVFDFDDAAYFWYAADIAFALDDVLDQSADSARAIIQNFLKGYRRQRELASVWVDSLPFFVRLMRVMKTARVFHAFAGTHAELDPPWLATLRERLMHTCKAQQQDYRQPFLAPLSAAEHEIWGTLVHVNTLFQKTSISF